jgi:stage III sporulation protein AG
VFGLAAIALLWVAGRVGMGLTALATPERALSPTASTGASGTGSSSTTTAHGVLSSGGVSGGAYASGTGDAGGGRAYEQAIAADLERLLSSIQGAGQVRVSVSLAKGPAYVFGHNTTNDTRTTEERDSDGATRTVQEVTASQQPVILRDGSQGEHPLIAEEQRPEVSGVLVLAQGAGDSRVRLNLVRAVQALYPLPTHRITVLTTGR